MIDCLIYLIKYSYKKYSETYSSIEIEIIINNIIDKEYFIRFKEENKKFFHIYFNDSGEEEKKNYLVHKESNKKNKNNNRSSI